jgi:hypothetical protein
MNLMRKILQETCPVCQKEVNLRKTIVYDQVSQDTFHPSCWYVYRERIKQNSQEACEQISEE